LQTALPVRRSFRHVKSSKRYNLDLRSSLRMIVKFDGDVPHLISRHRPSVPRKLLLLIDISGSMKLHTAEHLELAHCIAQNARSVEVFTIGTKLTRVTSALRKRDKGAALEHVADLVLDWDGGTRIGPTILALLKVPRYAAFARGACVIVISDGLERGGHTDFQSGVSRLSLLAHRMSLCTPLAADPMFRPQTGAIKSVLPYLDDLVDGSSLLKLVDFILALARPTVPAETVWRDKHDFKNR
jgi:uncharacterized protein